MKITRTILLFLLALLLPFGGFAHAKHFKQSKHGTYDYLGKKKQHKPSVFRSPVSGHLVPGKPVHNKPAHN